MSEYEQARAAIERLAEQARTTAGSAKGREWVHEDRAIALGGIGLAEREAALRERVETELDNAEVQPDCFDQDDQAWVEVAVIRAALAEAEAEE